MLLIDSVARARATRSGMSTSGATGSQPVCETMGIDTVQEEGHEVCAICLEDIVHESGRGGIIACCQCNKEVHLTCAMRMLNKDCPSCREPMFPNVPGHEEHGDVWTALEKCKKENKMKTEQINKMKTEQVGTKQKKKKTSQCRNSKSRFWGDFSQVSIKFEPISLN